MSGTGLMNEHLVCYSCVFWPWDGLVWYDIHERYIQPNHFPVLLKFDAFTCYITRLSNQPHLYRFATTTIALVRLTRAVRKRSSCFVFIAAPARIDYDLPEQTDNFIILPYITNGSPPISIICIIRIFVLIRYELRQTPEE